MRKILWTAGILISGFSGCFGSSPPPVDVLLAPDQTVLDVVVQHGPEFERFHLVREVLWQECGTVQEDAFAPAETHVSMLNETERNMLLRRLSRLLGRLAEDPEELPAVEKTDSDVIQIMVRQGEAENALQTPERSIRDSTSASTRLLAQLMGTFNGKRAGICKEEGL